jgi:hypothetical protein
MPDACMELERGKLGPVVDVELKGARLDFDLAEALAWTVARRLKKDPMLLAWYDRAAGRFSPPVTCCGEDRPAWVVYAQSRGADLAVSVNREDFVFLFWGEPA